MSIDTWRDHGADKGINGADKQALIDLTNAADTNQSTVKTNIATALNAVSTDKALGLTAASTWAEITAKILQVKTGKKYATGTTAITTPNQTIVVSGLSFQPRVIIVHGSVSGESSYLQVASTPDGSTQLQDDPYNGYVNVGQTANVTKTVNGFTYEIGDNQRNKWSSPVTWYAFE
ncbi:hypothetical protein NST23_24620 [Brevibacillus sp. FSL K6-0770]|uniref:hypothetical protein n=1 Tax=Brevibacillus sp. FSL K6-0770 TaxID=2954673 RepID=UPI0030F93D66